LIAVQNIQSKTAYDKISEKVYHAQFCSTITPNPKDGIGSK